MAAQFQALGDGAGISRGRRVCRPSDKLSATELDTPFDKHGAT